MKDFFQQYPHAKSYFQVGKRTFLNHCQKQAKLFAIQSGEKLVEVFPSTKDETEGEGEVIQLNDDLPEVKSTNKKSTRKSTNKNQS